MTKFEYYKTLPFKLGDIVEFPHWHKPEAAYGIVHEIRLAYEPGTNKVIPGREIYTVKNAVYPDLDRTVPVAWSAESLKHTTMPCFLTTSERITMEKQEREWASSEPLDLTGKRALT